VKRLCLPCRPTLFLRPFGGGKVPPTPGWEKVRSGRATVRKWVNWSAGCWVTLHQGQTGCHVGYAQAYEGFKEGMTAAQAVEYCRQKWAARVASN